MTTRWRDIIDEINVTANGYVLCVSGGVDSMFLLAFFAKNCTERPLKVAHFNHGLRAVAEQEEAFVRDVCADLGVPFLTAKGDPEVMRSAASLEAEARRQRYAFFETIKGEGEMLVTGHHANDQLETFLLRAMRGYPDDNLRMKRINGTRYRPLLGIPKAVIVDQARRRGIRWMEDDSNSDNAIERNWVRNVLVPQMMERRNVLKTIGMKSENPELDPQHTIRSP
jgi:tRNA(Ile)-lysidine synthase